MASEDLKNILLHANLNGRSKKSYLQGWDFIEKTHKGNCEIFETVKISKQVYKGGTTSKTTIRADANRSSHGKKGGESASPTNLNKGRAVKIKKKHAGHMSSCTTGEKNACFMDPDTPQRSVKY